MRPKTVMIVFLGGLGALVVLILVKAGFGSRDGSPDPGASNPPVHVQVSNPPVVVAPTNRLAPPGTNIVAMTPEEERQARVEQDLDEIREALGRSNPGPLMDKLTNSEIEVRKEAVQALKALDCTAAIPRLKAALEACQDLKEKVAILETIEFLQLTNAADAFPPDSPMMDTNQPVFRRVPGTEATGGRFKSVGPPSRSKLKPPLGGPAPAPGP